MNELALFCGAGGGLLASRLLGWRTVCAVERDEYRRNVILARQRDGHLEPFPVWDDVRTFGGRPWRGLADVVSGGFPCQPFSAAGRRRGADDPRNMWPDTIRIIRDVRPRYAFLENVPALLTNRYFGRILGDLAESGYDAVWDCIPACSVGAPHRRDRLWILAYPATVGPLHRLDSAGPDKTGSNGRWLLEPERVGVRDRDGDQVYADSDLLHADAPGHGASEDGGERTAAQALRGELPDGGEFRVPSGIPDALGDELRQQRERRRKQRGEPGATESGDDGKEKHLADADDERRDGRRLDGPLAKGGLTAGVGPPEGGRTRWPPEPGLGRVVDELAARMELIGRITTGGLR